jgi:dienelactone hydrolase
MALESDVTIAADDGPLHGTLCQGQMNRRVPGAVIVGGTISHDRDGRCIDPSRGRVPARDALRRLAHELAAAGIATLRYDRRRSGDVATEARDISAAHAALASCDGVDADIVGILGESAGAYLACVAMGQGLAPAFCVTLGALYGSVRDLYEYNFERLRRYAFSDPERLTWVMETAPRDLAVGMNVPRLIEAAAQGTERLVISNGRDEFHYGLRQMRYELTHPAATLFENVRCPTLILHGSDDMNVPAADAYGIAAELRGSGNADVSVRIIDGADHSFQQSAPTFEKRLRERTSLRSFARPYVGEVYTAAVEFVGAVVSSGGVTSHV